MERSRCVISGLACSLASLAVLVGIARSAAAETSVVWPTEQWQTSAPEEQGMESAALARLVDFGHIRGFDSLLIARHGRLVLDAYYAPYSAEVPHVINSSTKAVIGTLTAIALKEGLLDSTDHPVLDFFDGGSGAANLDHRKKAITVQGLLDMTSGLSWKEPLDDSRPDSMIEMERSADWIKFILDRPMAKSPGESFTYNSGNPHLLSAILAKLTGMSAEDYARAKLFGPLGITDWKWRRDPQGVSTGGYGLSMHPRDMAKFGYLYLRGGEWEGKPLVSSDWIDKVTHAAIDMNAAFAPALRYSNLFWALPDSKVYWSQGYHCQMIIVYPAHDMVAVATGRDGCSLVSLITDIASTVKSEDALPANAAGAQLLAGAIRDAASLKPTAVGPMSPIAASISGKTYNFPRSSLALKSLALAFDDKHPTYELEFYNRNPNNPSQKLTGAIGLDGLYRKGEFAGAGVPAVRGKWLNDRTFEIERLTVGAGNPQQKWTLWFDGDLLSIRGMDYDRRDMTINGRRGN